MSKQPHRRPNRWSKSSIVCSASVHQTPTVIDEQTRVLRERLIHEEFEELKEAMAKNDLFAVAKEHGSLVCRLWDRSIRMVSTWSRSFARSAPVQYEQSRRL